MTLNCEAETNGTEAEQDRTEQALQDENKDAARKLTLCPDRPVAETDPPRASRTIYCDGSADGSSIHEWCVVTPDGPIVGSMEGNYTNNQMEYYAMIEALKMASPGDVVCCDSLLVVSQLRGKWRVKDEELKPLAAQARAIRKEKRVQIWWVPRARNLAGLHLEGKFR